MERRDCFGSIREIVFENGLTRTEAKLECRDCEQFRDCLRESKRLAEENREKEELRKQNVIAKIIDLSTVFSNDLGSCLLEFLNRIYNSPLGTILFRNLLVFYEISESEILSPLTIPINQEILDLLQPREEEPSGGTDRPTPGPSKHGGYIRLILIKRSIQNNRKANIGLIAHQVVRMFLMDETGIQQIRLTLSNPEKELFQKMDERQRIPWLLKRWGFLEELEAMRQALSTFRT